MKTFIMPLNIDRISSTGTVVDTIKNRESGVINEQSFDKYPNCKRSSERGFSCSLVSQN